MGAVHDLSNVHQSDAVGWIFTQARLRNSYNQGVRVMLLFIRGLLRYSPRYWQSDCSFGPGTQMMWAHSRSAFLNHLDASHGPQHGASRALEWVYSLSGSLILSRPGMTLTQKWVTICHHHEPVQLVKQMVRHLWSWQDWHICCI